jgi:hypothetical protein
VITNYSGGTFTAPKSTSITSYVTETFASYHCKMIRFSNLTADTHAEEDTVNVQKVCCEEFIYLRC